MIRSHTDRQRALSVPSRTWLGGLVPASENSRGSGGTQPGVLAKNSWSEIPRDFASASYASASAFTVRWIGEVPRSARR